MSQNTNQNTKGPQKPRLFAGRHAARFAAVQAIYQISQDESQNVDRVLMQFVQHRLNEDMDGFALRELDRPFFAETVRGALDNLVEINDMLTAVLPEDWRVDRLDAVLRALLQSATFELAYREDVPPRVILDEYVEIANGFFSDREPKLVNGALDQIAKQLRPDELKE